MARPPRLFTWSRLVIRPGVAPGTRETFTGTVADFAARLGVSPQAVRKARDAGRAVQWWRCDGPAT